MNSASTRLRLAIFEIPPHEEAYLRQSGLAPHELSFYPEPLHPENLKLAREAEVLSVFIYSRLGAGAVAAA